MTATLRRRIERAAASVAWREQLRENLGFLPAECRAKARGRMRRVKQGDMLGLARAVLTAAPDWWRRGVLLELAAVHGMPQTPADLDTDACYYCGLPVEVRSGGGAGAQAPFPKMKRSPRVQTNT